MMKNETVLLDDDNNRTLLFNEFFIMGLFKLFCLMMEMITILAYILMEGYSIKANSHQSYVNMIPSFIHQLCVDLHAHVANDLFACHDYDTHQSFGYHFQVFFVVYPGCVECMAHSVVCSHCTVCSMEYATILVVLHFILAIQLSVVIMHSSIVRYYMNNYRNGGRMSIRCWIHERHLIPRHNGWCMGCLLWIFFRKLTML